MLNARTTSRLASAACALALTGALASTADARAVVKAAAPTLTIEAKNCSIGATSSERSATVTSLALLGGTGERVTMRFSLQSRQGKAKWKSVLFKDPTKRWETTEAPGAGLKLTKTVPELLEGVEYRMIVEARAIDAGGKVVTKTARRTVACKQPLFTPTLSLGELEGTKVRDGEGDALVVPVRNLGRLPSEAYVISVSAADTRQELATVRSASLKGGATSRSTIALGGTCSGPLIVTVKEEGATSDLLTPEQTATVDCSGERVAAAAQRRR